MPVFSVADKRYFADFGSSRPSYKRKTIIHSASPREMLRRTARKPVAQRTLLRSIGDPSTDTAYTGSPSRCRASFNPAVFRNPCPGLPRAGY